MQPVLCSRSAGSNWKDRAAVSHNDRTQVGLCCRSEVHLAIVATRHCLAYLPR